MQLVAIDAEFSTSVDASGLFLGLWVLMKTNKGIVAAIRNYLSVPRSFHV